ncbi:5-methyltetrahydropteroyltriglutamate--homocysteine methyltransferase [bacterium HR21]|nr:5-methyltetrahydropteroyltriglutamate--homocysteine methyltransferase [bacterium HR21]
MRTFAFGFPRLGVHRQYKTLLERFWDGSLSSEAFQQGIAELKRERLQEYQGMDVIPSNELSLYDPMLDTAVMLGALPSRFRPYAGLSTYFALARGKHALELTKWFNTNYHYLVPELEEPTFELVQNFPLDDVRFHRHEGIETVPTLIGPYTFLRLSKRVRPAGDGLVRVAPLREEEFVEFGSAAVAAYSAVLHSLATEGVQLAVVHEPALALEVPESHWELLASWYGELSRCGVQLWVLCYYDSVSDYRRYSELPVAGIGLDFVSNDENWAELQRYGFPREKTLIAGILNGRQVWRSDLIERLRFLERLHLWVEELVIAPSCPLFHLPVTVSLERNLPEGLQERLAFARERIAELRLLKAAWEGDPGALREAQAQTQLLQTPFARNERVRQRVSALREGDFQRTPPAPLRRQLQQHRLQLPLLPTTTIGSFPQTAEIRRLRSQYARGELSASAYAAAIEQHIRHAIAVQEELGLDVLVHGEFERSDMVEYFAQRLEGFATTEHGWVLSYGSRVYRPPIIYGDVWRPAPMTVREITYAQSLTSKPVKGMLTGPVTMLLWSYWRQDIPAEELAYELALAIADEVRDLEAAGIRIIQIDEPAFREGAPLKRRHWDSYFRWAIRAFRLCHARARPETQIHTHMCYSEFNDIVHFIAELDFDVLSIEGSRSKGEIVDRFATLPPGSIHVGVGVYDVHSPAIPEVSDIEAILARVLQVLPPEAVWVNPDCGLKTRRWEEVIPALRNMVTAARRVAHRVHASSTNS